MRILLVHHGALPTPGQPCSGGALRAWFHGRALQGEGYEVLWLSRDQDGHGGFQGAVDLERRARACRPDRVLCVQPEDAAALRAGLPDVPLAVDLYAPRLLEAPFEGTLHQEAVVALRALAAGDVFLVSNPRQRLAWMGVLALAGLDVRTDPTRVVGLVAEPGPARRLPRSPRLVAGGAAWPWQDPVPALERVLRHLDRRGVGQIDWYGGAALIGESAAGWTLPRHDRLHARGWVAREELLAAYAGATAAVDWMAPNPEREVALSFRHMDYLGCGLPILSGPNTALADVLGDAGWIVDPRDEGSVEAALDTVIDDRQELRRASEAARELARSRFSLDVCEAPLLEWMANPTRHGRARGPLVDAAEALAQVAAAQAQSQGLQRALQKAEAEVEAKRVENGELSGQVRSLIGTVEGLTRTLDEVAGFKREAIAVLGSREETARRTSEALERELAILQADNMKKSAELSAMDRLRERLEQQLGQAKEEVLRRTKGGWGRR